MFQGIQFAWQSIFIQPSLKTFLNQAAYQTGYPINMAKKKEESEVLPKVEGKESKDVKEIKEPVKAAISKERLLTESSDNARELYNQSRYGNLLDDGRVQLSLIESLYLVEKARLKVFDGRNKPINYENHLKKSQKAEPNFWVRYCVYRDIRNRGYIIKTALKF